MLFQALIRRTDDRLAMRAKYFVIKSVGFFKKIVFLFLCTVHLILSEFILETNFFFPIINYVLFVNIWIS